MNMKKIISLLLVVFLIIIAVGCQQTPSDNDTSSDTGADKTDASNNKEPSETAEEPIKLVFYQNNGAGTGVGSEAGSTKEDYELVQKTILDETGILVEAIKQPAEGSAEKLAMLLAGGDQLDMWFGSWQTYKDSGVIHPITDLLEEAPAIKAAWDPWEAWPGVTDKDGNIWAVPRMTPTTAYPIFVRQDWLKKYGLTQPKTIDELNDVLYTFKEEDPFGNGATIPLITRGGNLNALEFAFVGGYVDIGRGPLIEQDGTVKPLQLADGYVDFLAQVQKWYADGIIHSENFGWDTGTVREQIVKGAVGASASWYSDVTVQSATMVENVPEASYGIYEPGLTGLNGQLIQTRTNASTNGLLLSSKCKYPDAAIKLVNWFYEDWENYQLGVAGVKDVHWKYVDGTKEEDHIVETISKVEGGGSGYYADFAFVIGLPMETLSVSYDKNGKRNMHNLWLAEHLDDFDAAKSPSDFGIFFDPNQLDENIPTNGDISRIMSEELIKFATGKRPLSDYNKFIDELYDAGLDDWISEHTRQYKLLTE